MPVGSVQRHGRYGPGFGDRGGLLPIYIADAPSETPSVVFSGLRLHSGDILASRGGGLSEAQCDEILDETLGVLRHPDFEVVFGPDSLTEVPLVARWPAPAGDAPAIEVSGSKCA